MRALALAQQKTFDAAISGSEALKQLFSVTGDDYGEARLNRLERVSLMRRKLQARHRGCVIDPRYSVRMVAWDSLTTVGCLFTALFTPYEVAFMDPATSPVDPVFLLNQASHVRAWHRCRSASCSSSN